MNSRTIFKTTMWGFILVITVTQQTYSMNPPIKNVSRQESERNNIVNMLHSTTPLPSSVCDEIIAYLPVMWKLSGTCDVGFSYDGSHDFTSRRVTLTDHGLIWSSHASIAHHDHKGNRRELLKNWERAPGEVSHLTSSRTLPDGSSYVAAAIAQNIPQFPLHNNHLNIWHMKPGEPETASPTIFELETHHSKKCGYSETVDSLVFSSDPGITYLAAASPKTIAVFRRNKMTHAFTLYLLLPSQNNQIYWSPPINISFPAKDQLVSLYGNAMKHWKLAANDTLITDFGAHITNNLDFLPADVVYFVECYADALAHTTRLGTYGLQRYDSLLMEPKGYKIARFDLTVNGNSSVELLPDVRQPNEGRHELPHPRPTNGGYLCAKAAAYGTNGHIIGGFNNGSIVVWDPHATHHPVVQILKAKQANVKHKGISSVAISPDCETIAAHDFSGVASIFQKTYGDDESDTSSK